MMSHKFFPAAVVGAMLLLSLLFYPFLPAQMPVHWNLEGTIDRMADKTVAVFTLPLITLLLLVALRARQSPAFEAKYGESRETQAFIIGLIALFMGFIHTVTLLVALNPEFDVVRAIAVGLGGLFAFMGNVMGRLRPNPMFGFRFVWTMTDDEVWRRTHRLGGRWLVISGIVIMLAALVVPPPIIFIVLMTLLLSGSIGMAVYARQLWQQRHTTVS